MSERTVAGRGGAFKRGWSTPADGAHRGATRLGPNCISRLGGFSNTESPLSEKEGKQS